MGAIIVRKLYPAQLRLNVLILLTVLYVDDFSDKLFNVIV
jgi:hypothetical protein